MKASDSLMRDITTVTVILILSSKHLAVSRKFPDFVVATALANTAITLCFHVYVAGTTHEPNLW